MNQIQQTIIEQMQFSQESSENKIKNYKLTNDVLSVIFTLEDRQLTVTYNKGADIYELTVHKLDEDKKPINGLIDFTNEVYWESLAYFFDVALDQLDFKPEVENSI